MPWGLNANYKDFDDVDAILDLGTTPSPDSTIFDELNSVELPFTLADSSVSFEKSAFNFGWLAIKLTAESVTAGQLLFLDVWRDDSETWFIIESHGVGIRWRAGVEAGNYQTGECSFGFNWLNW